MKRALNENGENLDELPKKGQESLEEETKESQEELDEREE